MRKIKNYIWLLCQGFDKNNSHTSFELFSIEISLTGHYIFPKVGTNFVNTYMYFECGHL